MGPCSKGIVLPKAWLDYQGEEKVEEVIVLGNTVLVIASKDDENIAREVMDLYEKGASRSGGVHPRPKGSS